jgi:hypothetical protein
MTLDNELKSILADAKNVAIRYKNKTKKPLGITGEIAELEAAYLLQLDLMPPRHPGYDATEIVNGATRRLQIKGRCLPKDHKPGHRIGSINTKKEFDAVLLVLLDEDFNAKIIYEATHDAVVKELQTIRPKAKRVRNDMSIEKFISISKGTVRWSRPTS